MGALGCWDTAQPGASREAKVVIQSNPEVKKKVENLYNSRISSSAAKKNGTKQGRDMYYSLTMAGATGMFSCIDRREFEAQILPNSRPQFSTQFSTLHSMKISNFLRF
jgi:hypothetical protein